MASLNSTMYTDWYGQASAAVQPSLNISHKAPRLLAHVYFALLPVVGGILCGNSTETVCLRELIDLRA